jgi:DNA polymerase III subunit gamma/tau
MADAPFVSLYRRFRPGRFDELRGQDHVVRALRSAVRDDRVSHAYLFSGPRGTGKTSSARILAKALNCEAPVEGEPCDRCLSCTEITQGNSLNVHELDAATNNGVDAMRDLVAHAGLGTPGRWKVYIIDEVHMLSTPASNALLKTLEEPPLHVVFVLATTDPQKVSPTIRSRTQHLEFRLLGAETLSDLLESVRAEAGLEVDDESVQVAVRRARGSARDALSALDQVVASGSSDAARPELSSVMAALSESDVSEVLITVSTLLAGGWGPQQLATELIDDLRQVFLAALAPDLCAVAGPSRQRFTSLAETMGLPRVVRSMEILGHAIIDMRDAPDAQVVLEIALVRSSRPDLDTGIEALSERVSVLEHQAAAAGPAPARLAEREVVPPAQAQPPQAGPQPSPPASGPPPSPAEVGRRPSIGAVIRGQDRPGAAGEADPGVERHDVQDGVDSSASSAPPPEAPPAPAPATTPQRVVDRDSLTAAWGDGVLRDLPLRVKARFSAGRFVAADAEGAQFALPNEAHRTGCIDLVPEVEEALARHFGTPVRLVLVVDGPGGRAPVAAGPHPPRPESPVVDDSDDDIEEVDPGDLLEESEGGADEESAAKARLLEAFPGASEVTE